MSSGLYAYYVQYMNAVKSKILSVIKNIQHREHILKIYKPMPLEDFKAFFEKMSPQEQANFQAEIDRFLSNSKLANHK